MYERLAALVLRWLKVPPEPQPPFGDPASLRVFRAGRNLFKLRLFGWAFAQTAALAGIVFWAVILLQVEDMARAQKAARANQPPPTPASLAESVWVASAPAPTQPKGTPEPKSAKKRRTITGWAGFKQSLVEIALVLPGWAFPVIWLLKVTGFGLYLWQIPFTYATMRLDYEMRWYVVTDRSLRIRTGVWKVQELTMSFANLQQVVVTQGPLQRLLGLADVCVQSAGGGGGPSHHQQHGESLHTGLFHGVEHATEIRDLILERLRQFRQAGLGDPEDHGAPAHAVGTVSSPSTTADTVAAAREVLAEARALRAALA